MRSTYWKYLLIFLAGQLIGIIVSLVFGVMQGLNFIGLEIPDLGDIAYTLPMLVANAFILVLCALTWPADVTSDTLVSGWRKPHTAVTLRYIMASLGIIPALNILQELLISDLPDWIGAERLDIILSHPVGIVTVCLLGPAAEECIFRAGMIRLPAPDVTPSPRRGIFISSLLFALIHFNPAQMPAAFLMGLVLGAAYWQTQSLTAPLVIHIINNTLAVIVALTADADISFTQYIGGTMPSIIVAVAGVIWAFFWLKSNFSIYNKV